MYIWTTEQEEVRQKWLAVGRFENTKKSNINLNQMGSHGTHKNKTYLSKEKKEKVHIRIGKCI